MMTSDLRAELLKRSDVPMSARLRKREFPFRDSLQKCKNTEFNLTHNINVLEQRAWEADVGKKGTLEKTRKEWAEIFPHEIVHDDDWFTLDKETLTSAVKRIGDLIVKHQFRINSGKCTLAWCHVSRCRRFHELVVLYLNSME